MSLLSELSNLGINVDAGLAHFKGRSDFFEKLLRRFPESVEGREVQPLINAGQIKEAYEQAHALKGICANLYITPLYELYTKVSDSLKAGQTEGVSEILNQIEPLQKQIINIIGDN